MPLIIREDDMDFERVRRAYEVQSFASEKRAQQRQTDYVQDVQSVYAAMQKIAETPEQQVILDSAIETYKADYLKYFYAVIDAKGRTMSVMIAGPSNFNARRNEKRMATEQKRVEEFHAWQKRAQASIQKAILNARSVEQKVSQAWNLLRADMERSLRVIADIDSGKNRYSARALFVSSIAGKIERVAKAGDVWMVDQALDLVRTYNADHAKPAFTAKHSVWKLHDVATAVQAKHKQYIATIAQTPEAATNVLGVYGDVQIVDNIEADRIQILFPGRPDEPTMRALKGAAWRWSPSNKVWQRQRTSAARYSAEQICKGLGV